MIIIRKKCILSLFCKNIYHFYDDSIRFSYIKTVYTPTSFKFYNAQPSQWNHVISSTEDLIEFCCFVNLFCVIQDRGSCWNHGINNIAKHAKDELVCLTWNFASIFMMTHSDLYIITKISTIICNILKDLFSCFTYILDKSFKWFSLFFFKNINNGPVHIYSFSWKILVHLQIVNNMVGTKHSDVHLI